MSGVPPPPQQQPPSSNFRGNSMRKPPPPPPTRAIEDIEKNMQSAENSKARKQKKSQEGTFSNPIDGAVYQDEKGYDFLFLGSLAMYSFFFTPQQPADNEIQIRHGSG